MLTECRCCDWSALVKPILSAQAILFVVLVHYLQSIYFQPALENGEGIDNFSPLFSESQQQWDRIPCHVFSQI